MLTLNIQHFRFWNRMLLKGLSQVIKIYPVLSFSHVHFDHLRIELATTREISNH